MPGRIMAQDGEKGLGELKKDRSQAQGDDGTSAGAVPAAVSAPSSAVQQPNGKAEHGVNGMIPNGISDGSSHGANGSSNAKDVAFAEAELAPSLDQSWRESGAFPKLGKILERQAHYCYQSLCNTLTAMADVPPDAPKQLKDSQKLPNGIVSHSPTEDQSEASQEKKRLMLTFAKEQRDFFIKSLVLLEWCRNGDGIYKLKDVSEWQRKQRGAQMAAADAFLAMKANMMPAKMPNPNIEGAMELLSTSKASWIPDLNYLPAKRLSAKQLLNTLRNMNVILATRLVLHEELPQRMRDYTILDGRATFTVKDEFEVDLSVADEDPSTPFYFIDIRLLYQPSSIALDNRFRGEAEGRVNHVLATKGLSGAYDFLHNYVLTHKINVLRSQAGEMMRGKWFDCLRVEMVHRVLVVQYWRGLPGKKSWLEFGITSGKDKVSSQFNATPQIEVRWFRQGVQITDAKIDVDWKNISLEHCLMAVIERHTSWLLEAMEAGVRALVAAQTPSRCESKIVDTSTGHRALSLSLPSLHTPLTAHIEPVTGQVAISPVSRSTRDTAQRLNKDVTDGRPRWLASLVCALAQERMHLEAQLLGWSPASGLVRQDNLSTLFGGKTRHTIFRPSQAWGADWALAVSFGLNAENWWACQLVEKVGEQGQVLGKIVSFARAVSLGDDMSTRSPISKATLLHVEKRAVAEVAFAALSTELKAMGIPHQLQRLAAVGRNSHSIQNQPTSPAMIISFSTLMEQTGNKKRKGWADETIRLTHHGLTEDSDASATGAAEVRHDLRLTLASGRMQHLQKHLGSISRDGIALNSTGGLALKLLTEFGKPFARQIQSRLRSVERLNHYLSRLKQHKFEVDEVSLARLSFVYNSSPRLSAALIFNKDGSGPARLELQPQGSNLHHRIRTILEKSFNTTGEAGFSSVLYVMTATIPLLQALERLEAVAPAKRTLDAHARSPVWFVLRYREPLPSLTFHVRMKMKRQGDVKRPVWHVQRIKTSSGPNATAEQQQQQQPHEQVLKGLGEVWNGKGEHWVGLGNGAAADSSGVAEVVEKLDSVLRLFEGLVSAAPAPSAADTSATDASAAPAPAAQAKSEEKKAPSQQQQQLPKSSQAQSQGNKKTGPQTQPAKTQMQRKPSKQGKTSVKQEKDVITLD